MIARQRQAIEIALQADDAARTASAPGAGSAAGGRGGAAAGRSSSRLIDLRTVPAAKRPGEWQGKAQVLPL